jgi:hypothetical protein
VLERGCQIAAIHVMLFPKNLRSHAPAKREQSTVKESCHEPDPTNADRHTDRHAQDVCGHAQKYNPKKKDQEQDHGCQRNLP